MLKHMRWPLILLLVVIGTFLFPSPKPSLAQVGGASSTPPRGRVTPTPRPVRTTAAPRPTQTITRTATLDLPQATATPRNLRMPPPPEVNPYRTPQKPIAANPSPTSPLPVSADPDTLRKVDLVADEIEVTQVIQDLQNRMPLVAGRATVIRVYMHTIGGKMTGVRGILEITGPGGKKTMFADNAPIVAQESGGDRINLNDSLYFYMPTQYAKGKVKFRVFIYAVDPSWPFFYEKDAQNNFNEVNVEFKPGQGAVVVMPSVHAHHSDKDGITDTDGTLYKFDSNAVHIGYDVRRFYPINAITIIPGPDIYPKDHTYDDKNDLTKDWYLVNHNKSAGEMLDDIEYERAQDTKYGSSFWYGMIDPTIEWWWDIVKDGKKTGGQFYATGMSNGTVAVGLMLTNHDEDSPWWVEGGMTGAHEGGHNYGLGHYNCAGNESLGGGVDPNYPYPYDKGKGLACSLAAVDPKGFYGFDVYYANWSHLTGPTVISNDPAAGTPNRGFPLMGYKRPQFMDVYTYCKLLVAFGVDCNLANLGVSALPAGVKVASLDLAPSSHGELPMNLQQANEYLYVSGILDNEHASGELRYSERYTTPTENMLSSAKQRQVLIDQLKAQRVDTPYELTLDDANGAILFRTPLYDLSNVHEVQNPTFGFTELVPFVEGTAFIRIRYANKIVDERRVSATAPTVKLLTQNEGGMLSAPLVIQWKGSDADLNNLTYNLQYSADGGKTWLSVASHILEQSIKLDSLAGLPGSDGKSLFRVVAIDGVNTTSDESDIPFSVPNNPPSALIFAPVSDRSSPQGGSIEFTGQGYDLEEGRLPDEAMVWTSDLDGEIGTGSEFHTRTLSAGLHTITLTVKDGQGLTGTATSYIYIDPSLVIPLPDDAEVASANNIMNGIIPQLTATPTTVQPAATATPLAASQPATDTGIPMIVWVIAGVLLVVIAAFLLMRRKK